MHPSPATVSVVITSRNEGDYLARTVDSLLRHLPKGGEILVVDDASSDGSAERLPGAGRAVTVHRLAKRMAVPFGIVPSTRNRRQLDTFARMKMDSAS